MFRKRRVKASLLKCYVFPDGTAIQWADSAERIAVIPARSPRSGIMLSASDFGGVVFMHSVRIKENGNPDV